VSIAALFATATKDTPNSEAGKTKGRTRARRGQLDRRGV